MSEARNPSVSPSVKPHLPTATSNERSHKCYISNRAFFCSSEDWIRYFSCKVQKIRFWFHGKEHVFSNRTNENLHLLFGSVSPVKLLSSTDKSIACQPGKKISISYWSWNVRPWSYSYLSFTNMNQTVLRHPQEVLALLLSIGFSHFWLW